MSDATEVIDVLRVRLFGFGVPYRAHLVNGAVESVATEPRTEAADLADALGRLAADGLAENGNENAWVVSVPFGRCGFRGLPREHLMVFFANEALLDILTMSGPEVQKIHEGEIIAIEPQTVVRLRAQTSGGRALVAFQTQDRTPLMGNAAPFTLDGEIPQRYDERLRKGHRAFDTLQQLWGIDRARYERSLRQFFDSMEASIVGDKAIQVISAEAKEAGSYDAVDESACFEYQRSMIDDNLLTRIRGQDTDLFRFPGMFGGITTLFNYLS